MSDPICYECLKPMIKKHGIISINRKDFGEYEVPGVLHFSCEQCGSKIIPPQESARIIQDGLKLHILKVLNKDGADSVLNLSRKLSCELDELNTVLSQLKKEKLITISDKGRFPTIALKLTNPNKKISLLDRLDRLIARFL